MSKAAIWVVVPGAGTGRRFGGRRPKQYVSLAGHTVAQRTLTQLISTGLFSKVVVALAGDDEFFSELPIAQSNQIETVVGGASRSVSVLNGLQALDGRASTNDWVLVHDIARPLVTVEALHRLVDSVGKQDVAAILAARIHDTVKRASVATSASHSLPVIEATLDRHQLWVAQTPQMVRYGLLVSALTQAHQKRQVVTDEASAVELLNQPVLLVENTQQNIKITTAEDLRLAEYYLSNIANINEVSQ